VGDEDRVRLSIEGPGGVLAVTLLEPSAHATTLCEWIFFLHPTNLDSRCWLPVATRLNGHRRVLLDSRGHGASHQRGPFSVADYAADVRAVMDELAIERVHLVGGSLGGSIACAVAGCVPARVASVTAVGAALEPADPATVARLEGAFESASLHEIFAAAMEPEMAHGLAPALADEALLQVGVDRRDRNMIREITLNAFTEDATSYARNVSCPVCVLSGEFDESCPPEAGRRMAALLRGRFELLPSLGHLAMMQAPDLIGRKVSDFVAEVSR
jgi:3-oxoadipate enol-lactonase